MFAKRERSVGLMVLLATTASTLNAGKVRAEPSIHYADAPAVLPAPITYETARITPSATVTYAESPTYVTYRRTYTQPSCTTRRVVYTAPVVRYEEPVIYTRTYHAPRRVLHLSTGPYVYPRRVYRHHRYPRWHHRPWSRFLRPDRWHWRPHHRRHRSHDWGFSLGYGRGHHGHHRGGFSFYFNR